MKKLIKKEMEEWYGFVLTDEQIQEWIDINKIESFDTLERSDFVDYLCRKITGLEYPMNADSYEYKMKVLKSLRENSSKMGYKFII